jgi:hypothetical protein
VLGADRRAEEAQLFHSLDDLGGPDVVVLERVNVRLDLTFEKARDAVEDQRILIDVVHVRTTLGGSSDMGSSWGEPDDIAPSYPPRRDQSAFSARALRASNESEACARECHFVDHDRCQRDSRPAGKTPSLKSIPDGLLLAGSKNLL